MEEKVFIFDIDGTLASKRYPYLSLLNIPPIKKVVSRALKAQKSAKGKMAIVTARPESLRKDTEAWVENLGLKPEILLMRANDDYRPDYEVRVDQVRKVMDTLGQNAILYDDKDTNCAAVRHSLNIPTKHVTPK